MGSVALQLVVRPESLCVPLGLSGYYQAALKPQATNNIDFKPLKFVDPCRVLSQTRARGPEP